MKFALHELSPQQVVRNNEIVLWDAQQKDPTCTPIHALRGGTSGPLQGCIDSIFIQLKGVGYANAPLEKMAGLLLARISQGQYFVEGNKRTALLSCIQFLWNNGHKLNVDEDETFALLDGLAVRPPSKTEDDAVQFIFDNIYPVI